MFLATNYAHPENLVTLLALGIGNLKIPGEGGRTS